MPSPWPDDVTRQLIHLIRSQIRFRRGRQQPEVEDDLVQDVLVSVLRQLPQYDPRRAPLTAFVRQIAHSTLIDLARRDSADKRNPLRHPDSRYDIHPASLDAFADKPDPLGQGELLAALEAALQELPPELERVARELREWTPTEIAEREGVHPGTIYRRIAKLKDRWQDTSLKDFLDP